MSAITKKFTVILDPEDDGSYSVYCPALAGCVSQGEDRNEPKDEINHLWGRNGCTVTGRPGDDRCIYFDDPDGHRLQALYPGGKG